MTGFYEKSRLTARSLLQAGVHLTPLTLTGHIRAHQRDIIGLTMVIPWALKRPILSILKCLGVCNRLVRLNCHKKIYCDNEFTYYIHLKTYLVIYSRKFSSAHFMSTVNPMMSSWWPDLYTYRPKIPIRLLTLIRFEWHAQEDNCSNRLRHVPGHSYTMF